MKYINHYGSLAFYRYPDDMDVYNPWRLRAASPTSPYFDVAAFESKQAMLDHFRLIIAELDRIPDEPADSHTEYGLILTRQ